MNCPVCGRFMRKRPRTGLSPLGEIEGQGMWRCVKAYWDSQEGTLEHA